MRLALLLPAVLLVGAWSEPPRSMAPTPIPCPAAIAIDVDTLRCSDGLRVRLRHIDGDERGSPRWHAARAALQRWLDAGPVVVVPHHRSWNRVVGDVLVNNINVGIALDQAGWSKPHGARR